MDLLEPSRIAFKVRGFFFLIFIRGTTPRIWETAKSEV